MRASIPALSDAHSPDPWLPVRKGPWAELLSVVSGCLLSWGHRGAPLSATVQTAGRGSHSEGQSEADECLLPRSLLTGLPVAPFRLPAVCAGTSGFHAARIACAEMSLRTTKRMKPRTLPLHPPPRARPGSLTLLAAVHHSPATMDGSTLLGGSAQRRWQLRPPKSRVRPRRALAKKRTAKVSFL